MCGVEGVCVRGDMSGGGDGGCVRGDMSGGGDGVCVWCVEGVCV